MIIREDLNDFLETLVDSLEVPESMYQKAIRRFASITDHLRRPTSTLRKYNLNLYPQGSFNLGTAIKPVNEDGEYDVDVVCEINESKFQISQKNLKDAIGYEIQEYQRINGFVKNPVNNRRCWTLEYSDTEQFHMDILPAIPDKQGFEGLLLEKRASAGWTGTAVAITDQQHPLYSTITQNWYVSNPKGYAEWFKSKITISIQKIAEAGRVQVDQIPTYDVKSPLQKAIQILKRHRDIMFQNDPDDKPISVIITTLAAHMYRSENTLLQALSNVISGISNFLDNTPTNFQITNPVNPLENFADKWKENPSREQAFRFWVSKVNDDLGAALEAGDVSTVAELFASSFGEKMIKTAVEKYNVKKNSYQQVVLNESVLPSRFNVSHRQPIKWSENLNGVVKVVAKVSKSGFRPFIAPSNSKPIDKHCPLRFEASTNVHPPFRVYWQVVNTGNEAYYKSALRGGFYDGFIEEGKLVRKESTLYTGMHWVECFIVKDNVCVARSGEYVINIK